MRAMNEADDPDDLEAIWGTRAEAFCAALGAGYANVWRCPHPLALGGNAMRRTHLRGHTNILKRLLIHAGAFNLARLLRHFFGFGTPRGRASSCAPLLSLYRALRPLIADQIPIRGYHACRPLSPILAVSPIPGRLPPRAASCLRSSGTGRPNPESSQTRHQKKGFPGARGRPLFVHRLNRSGILAIPGQRCLGLTHRRTVLRRWVAGRCLHLALQQFLQVLRRDGLAVVHALLRFPDER